MGFVSDFEWVLSATFRQFLRLRFCVTWARILLLFEAFGSGLPRSDFKTKVFFAGGNLFLSLSFEWVLYATFRQFLRFAVLRDLGSNPAAV